MNLRLLTVLLLVLGCQTNVVTRTSDARQGPSAKGNYDAQSAELTQVSANILMLDHVLSHYGLGTNEALKGAVVHALDKTWSQSRRGPSQVDSGSHGNEFLYGKDSYTLAEGRGSAVTKVRSAQYSLEPWTDSLVDVRATSDIGCKAVGDRDGVLAHDYICALGTLRTDQRYSHRHIFCCWSRRFGCNLFDLEIYAPYSGLIQVSSTPLRAALAQLGQ